MTCRSMIALPVVLLAACTTVPRLDVDSPTAANLFQNVQCELQEAYQGDFGYLANGWTAAYTLTLSVFQKAGASGDASLLVPLTPGLFTAGLGLGGSAEATRTEETKHQIHIADLSKKDCSSWNQGEGDLLAGRLGIRKWLERLDEGRDRLGSTGPETLQSSSMTVNFVIKVNGNAGPKFTMFPLGSDTIGGSFKFEGNKDRTHKLILALGAPSGTGTTPPGARSRRPAGFGRSSADQANEALNRALFFDAIRERDQ